MRDVPERHVVGPDHVGEVGGDIATVGLQNQRLCHVSELHVDVIQVWVVGNNHLIDGLEVDAIQSVQLCVLDGDNASLLDTLGEGQALQRRQRGPFDGLHVDERREVQRRQNGHAGERERVTDDGQAITGQRSHLRDIIRNQAARYSLDAIERDAVCGAGRNGDASGERLTRGEGRGVGGVRNGSGGRAARSCPDRVSARPFTSHTGVVWMCSCLPAARPAMANAGTRYLIAIWVFGGPRRG